jgi:hypothetical protein
MPHQNKPVVFPATDGSIHAESASYGAYIKVVLSADPLYIQAVHQLAQKAKLEREDFKSRLIAIHAREGALFPFMKRELVVRTAKKVPPKASPVPTRLPDVLHMGPVYVPVCTKATPREGCHRYDFLDDEEIYGPIYNAALLDGEHGISFDYDFLNSNHY